MLTKLRTMLAGFALVGTIWLASNSGCDLNGGYGGLLGNYGGLYDNYGGSYGNYGGTYSTPCNYNCGGGWGGYDGGYYTQPAYYDEYYEEDTYWSYGDGGWW